MRDLLMDKVQGNLYCRMVRRSLLAGVQAPAGNMGEDLVLTLQTALRAKSYGHIDEPFYLYRYHASSVSKAQGKDTAIRRHHALVANVRLLVELLTKSYGFDEDDPAIISFKYYSRHCIEPFVGDRACYSLWRNTFPEIDRRLVFTPGIGLEKKMWFVLIHMHLYKAVKGITRRKNR